MIWFCLYVILIQPLLIALFLCWQAFLVLTYPHWDKEHKEMVIVSIFRELDFGIGSWVNNEPMKNLSWYIGRLYK